MNSIYFLPTELPTTELIEVVESVDDFFAEPYDSYAQLCLAELNNRKSSDNEKCNIPTENDNELLFEKMRTIANIRSGINTKLGRSFSYAIKNNSSENLTKEQHRALFLLAEDINLNYWNYPEYLFTDFATNGIFNGDDIIGLLNTVGNLRETENEITQIKRETLENNNKLIADNNSETNEPVKTKTAQINSIDTPKSILNNSSDNEKCRTKISLTTIYSWMMIMNTYFNADSKAMSTMKHLQKQAPKQFKYAAKYTLDNMAFDISKESKKPKNLGMTIRNKGLVRKSITYRPAKLQSVDLMSSEIGSSGIAERFTGFGEQEGTRTAKRKRIITKKGRGNRHKAILKKRARINNKMANIAEVEKMRGVRQTGPKSSVSRAIAYLMRLKREGGLAAKFGDSEYIMSSKTYSGGIVKKGSYKFIRRSGRIDRKTKRFQRGSALGLETQQYSPLQKSRLQPKRNLWLTRTTKSYMKTSRPVFHLRKNMDKQIKFLSKFKK